MATIVGVDLGSHSVKVAFSEGRSSGLEYRVRAVPQDGDLAPTLSQRLEVLRSLVSEIPELRDATATAAFPNEAASLRTVTLPFTDRGQVQKTLPFELEGHVPFDLDDFVLDYRVLRGGTDNSRVLCAMAGKPVLAELIAGLQEAGVEPRRMPLDTELLAAYAPPQGHQMVVDLGHPLHSWSNNVALVPGFNNGIYRMGSCIRARSSNHSISIDAHRPTSIALE